MTLYQSWNLDGLAIFQPLYYEIVLATQRSKNRTAIGIMIPIVSDLKYIQQFCPSYAQCRVAVDDFAELIPLLFNLNRRKATYLNAAFTNKSLSANKAVRNALNLPQNDIGIYQKKRITLPNILLFEIGVNDEINKRFYSDLRFVLRLHIRTRGKNKMDICTAHSMCRFVPSSYGANYYILYNIPPPRNKMD